MKKKIRYADKLYDLLFIDGAPQGWPYGRKNIDTKTIKLNSKPLPPKVKIGKKS